MLCLDSVSKAIQGLDAEIIVIDNNSEDESLALTHQHFPEVKTIANTKNTGFSKANNQAVKEAEGTYLCILNPDTVVSEHCFRNLLEVHKNHKDIGAIGTQLIDGNGNFLPESKRNIPHPKIAFQKLIGINHSYYDNSLTPEESGETSVLVGAFMFLKREDYTAIKGFDEDFFMYGEDIDLSYKLLKKGLRNYYAGELKTIHFKGESTLKDQKYYDRFFGAMLIFYQKHYSNKFFELNLKSALKIFKLKALKTQKKSPANTYHEAVIITENKSNFKALERHFKNLIFVKKEDIPHLKRITLEKKYVIFDAKAISYAEIIEKIVNWREIPAKYRIKPNQLSFCVGSDSKDMQGESLRLDL